MAKGEQMARARPRSNRAASDQSTMIALVHALAMRPRPGNVRPRVRQGDAWPSRTCPTCAGADRNLLKRLQLRLASETCGSSVSATGTTVWDVVEWILRSSSSAPVPLDSHWPLTWGFAAYAASWLRKSLN